ncbi:S-adenosyl-L-methionine-dependent methyltransferase [Nemania sp. FL0916]|nr:S-adenosyl-L-methionine-dependent methyltransferase [Nemania sp. FL0916]
MSSPTATATTTPSPSMLIRTYTVLLSLIDPWLFLSVSLRFIPQTISHILSTLPPLTALHTLLLSPSRFREAWFGQFWAYAGPRIRENAGPRVVLPLLDGRVTGGKVVEGKAVNKGVGGVVLEIGAAQGLWVNVFSDRYLYEDGDVMGAAVAGDQKSVSEGARKGEGRTKRPNTARTPVTHVYGVEPNPSHHAALRQAIVAAGLEDVYEIVPVGIEDLSSSPAFPSPTTSNGGKSKNKKWDGNISPGSVDCIVSVLCLCSIPDPEQHIRELYALLRPGGRWYCFEHVRNDYNWFMRLYQRFVNLAWPHLIGGCQLCRPTEKTLREAGPWTSIDVGHPDDELWHHTVPHILGVFTK